MVARVLVRVVLGYVEWTSSACGAVARGVGRLERDVRCVKPLEGIHGGVLGPGRGGYRVGLFSSVELSFYGVVGGMR